MKKESIFRFDSNTKQKRIFKCSLIAFFIVFASFVFTYTALHIVNINKTATIKILVAPTTATVYINDKPYGTNQTIKLEPGEYSIRISKDGFYDFTDAISIKKDESYNLYEILKERDENGFFYEDGGIEQSRSQQIYDFKVDQQRESFVNSDPIWKVVPYHNYSQGIDIYAQKDSSETTIIIKLQTCVDDTAEALKQNAINYLKNNNITLENYIIQYDKLC